MNGIIVVNKPQEFTSFDVVAIARGKMRTKKVGHSGTLDPMATGVLPVFVGGATKAISLVPDTDKSYRAEFRLGMTSDTLDIWGSCSEQRDVNVPLSELEQVLKKFRGEIEQVPPMYSALKIGGKKLCDLARQGIDVERKPRKITISSLELIEFDGRGGIIDVDCSSGTYIRSLCDDIGKAFGTGAVMTSLCRTRACGFDLSQAVTIEDLRSDKEIPLIPVESVFRPYRTITLDSEQLRLYLNGVRLDSERICEKPSDYNSDEFLRVYAKGDFIGIAKINEQGELVSVKRFCEDLNLVK